MTKRQGLIIAGKVFASRAAADRHSSWVLNNGVIDSLVVGEDSEFVEVLWLNRSDEYAECFGKRVMRFERRWHNRNQKRTRCFWAIFDDGTAIDFSVKSALDYIAKSQLKAKLRRQCGKPGV